jgi:DNA-binding NtrC family response regulator
MVDQADVTLPAPQPAPAFASAEVPGSPWWQQFECFIGVSASVTEMKKFVSAQAALSQPVLLRCEPGLRQEQVARALHRASERRERPFFAVNARGLTADALDHLLFGSRGAMIAMKSGTIYINELIELPAFVQQRLAVYIEEQRTSGAIRREAWPRLIFATDDENANRSAENRLAFGIAEQLRSSSLRLKPLRERSEDIPYLTRHLATRIANRLGKGAHVITGKAMEILMLYEWKRNIDELEKVLESVIANIPPSLIDETLLPYRVRHATMQMIPVEGVELPRIVVEYERSIIEMALQQASGNQSKAAQLLGLRVQTLNLKLKRIAESNKAAAATAELTMLSSKVIH